MLIIGIAGGTASGKTTVVNEILKSLPQDKVILVPQDAYYKDMSHLKMEDRLKVNYDHPDAIEFDLLVEHITQLKNGNSIQLPIYSYVTCTRSEETEKLDSKNIIIVEGIMILNDPALRDLFDIKVFVDAEADERLIRRIRRDVAKRGRSIDSVLDSYEFNVMPMHNQFVEPTKKYADIIVPQGGKNLVAIDILSTTINEKLKIINHS